MHDRKSEGRVAPSAGRHPKKEIAEALAECRAAGLEVWEVHRSNRWGRVVCPGCGEGESVSSTPRSPAIRAKRLIRFRDDHLGHVRRREGR